MPTIAPMQQVKFQGQTKPVKFTGKKDPTDALINDGWKDYNGKPMKVGKSGGVKKLIKMVVAAAVIVGAALHLVPASTLQKIPLAGNMAVQGKALVGSLLGKITGLFGKKPPVPTDVPPAVEKAAETVTQAVGEVVNKVV